MSGMCYHERTSQWRGSDRVNIPVSPEIQSVSVFSPLPSRTVERDEWTSPVDTKQFEAGDTLTGVWQMGENNDSTKGDVFGPNRQRVPKLTNFFLE